MEVSRLEVQARASPTAAMHVPVSIVTGLRVGVLTLHRCINYGSFWQTRALVDDLRARGHDVRVLDHRSWRIGRAEWACALRPRLPERGTAGEAVRYVAKVARFNIARRHLPLSRPFAIDRPSGLEPLDAVVVGSDEVWNLAHPMYGACELFFGEGVPAGRILSYAASFGSFDAGGGLHPGWTARLGRFSAISVRDENSRRIVARALGTDPEIALDPCLAMPLARRGRWRGPEGRFVIVYGHSFSKGFASGLRRWADRRGVALLSIGYLNEWADHQWLTAGPDDFAHAIARADAVATNFFHGCVFALRHDRPFACEPSPYRANKIHGLLTLLEAEPHLLADAPAPAELDRRLSEPPSAAVHRRIDSLRAASTAFLDRALA